MKIIVDANIVFSGILNTNCKLWTGDKKLINGLKKKNYHDILTTNDLLSIRNYSKSNTIN